MLAETDGRPVSDGELATHLGMHQSRLSLLKTQDLTAKQIAKMIAGARVTGHRRAEADAIKAIMEFLPLRKTLSRQEKKWELFSIGSAATVSPYLKGLRDKLRLTKGIYVFHDSRGRALYAGKTVKLSLWAEMNNAFNRPRAIQSVRRVMQPVNKKEFSENIGKRKIQPSALQLHDMAAYASAYEVSVGLISRFEAILIRSFANDLLNVKMESL